MKILDPAARLFCFLLLSACSQQQPAEVSASPPGPPGVPYFIDRTNSACRTELRDAQVDAQQGQLTYFLFQKVRYADDLDTLLRGHGIRFRYNPMNCTGEELCYAYAMDSIITRLHGSTFLGQLKQAANQRFAAAWRTRTYTYWDLDVPPQGGIQDLDEYVTVNLTRPQGWDTRPKRDTLAGYAERQYLIASLTVESNGQVGEISFPAHKPSNVKATNRRYLPFLKQEIRRLIRKAGPWQAGQLAGHWVRATLYVDVTLNP